jgi:hypothetical protein
MLQLPDTRLETHGSSGSCMQYPKRLLYIYNGLQI